MSSRLFFASIVLGFIPALYSSTNVLSIDVPGASPHLQTTCANALAGAGSLRIHEASKVERGLPIPEWALHESLRDSLRLSGKITLAIDPLIPYRSPELLTAIANGERIPLAYFIVHQHEGAQTEQTLQSLQSDPRFTTVPRFILAGGDTPLKSPELLDQATQVIYSYGGQLPERLVTLPIDEIHIAGGLRIACFNIMKARLLAGFFADPSRRKVIFVLHTKQIYDYFFDSQPFFAKDIVNYDELLRVVLEDHPGGELTDSQLNTPLNIPPIPYFRFWRSILDDAFLGGEESRQPSVTALERSISRRDGSIVGTFRYDIHGGYSQHIYKGIREHGEKDPVLTVQANHKIVEFRIEP